MNKITKRVLNKYKELGAKVLEFTRVQRLTFQLSLYAPYIEERGDYETQSYEYYEEREQYLNDFNLILDILEWGMRQRNMKKAREYKKNRYTGGRLKRL